MMRRGREARAFANAFSGEPPASEQVAGLVATAEAICQAAATVAPTPAFRSAVRTSLLAEAATVVTLVPPTQAGYTPRRVAPLGARLRRRAAVLTAAAVTIFGVLGVSTASASALPGDKLYPVKRALENTELALKRGDASRGALQLELATERIVETSGLTKRQGVPDSLEADTLTTYREQADQGSKALVRSFKADRDREGIVAINRFATRAYRGLTSLEGKLDGPAATVLAAAQKQLAGIVELSARLCPDCGGIDADLVSAILAPPGGAPAPAAPEPSDPAAAAPAGAPAEAAESESESESSSDESESDDSESSGSESDEESAGEDAEEQEPPAEEPPAEEPSHENDGHGNDDTKDHTDNGKGND